MLSKTKKPQLRRCAFCNKVGHNKATCDEFKQHLVSDNALKKTAPQPLKFFIHHVSHPPTQSPHIVNLKSPSSKIWNQLEDSAPENIETLYHNYHKIAPSIEKKSLFVELHSEKIKVKKAEIFPVIDEAPITIETVVEPDKKIPNDAAPKISFQQKITQKFSISKLQHIISPSGIQWQNFWTNFSARKLATLIALAFIIAVLPAQADTFYTHLQTTKTTISEDGTSGFLSLQESTLALKQADIATADIATQNALQKFNSAIYTLNNNYQILQTLASIIPVVGSEIKNREKLLLAGQQITLGNTFLLKGIKASQADPKVSLTDNINIIIKHLHAALPNYQKALQNLVEIDSNSLPLEYQNQFLTFRQLFQTVIHDFTTISNLGDAIQEIFGGAGLRRYLLVFQNQNEIRPTGGFMGSFAVIDIKDGKIVKMIIPPGGTYELQGLLRDYVQPPTPLLLSNKRWEFQDANWFPDFPASAQKMLWFFRESYPVTADGVIAINASVLERILSTIGPITDTKRDLSLSADNAINIIQKIVETGPEKQTNKPKQIISDLAPQFINYFQNISAKNILPLLINFQEALTQKEIQAYFTDVKTENTLQSLGWGGQILAVQSNQDYLNVVNANIQGQKSDAKIKQTISHQAIINYDGTVTDNLIITREHTGSNGEKLYGQPNIDYIRIYVPAGSTLVSASGFSWPDEKNFKVPEKYYSLDQDLQTNEKEISVDNQSGTRITNEFGKTTFGNWIVTEPGTISQIQLSYRLPFKIKKTDSISSKNSILNNLFQTINEEILTYQLVVQKQSGSNTAFESQIILPDSFAPFWSDGNNISLAKNGATIRNNLLLSDSIWSVIAKHK